MNIFFAQLITSNNLPHTQATPSTLKTVLDILFITIGALALLMIVIAGLRYVFAQGEPNKVAEAKNMILYALIGLIIAASATAIVNFVIGKT